LVISLPQDIQKSLGRKSWQNGRKGFGGKDTKIQPTEEGLSGTGRMG